MKILAIGDVTSPAGVEHLVKNLWEVRRRYGIDLCIVNAENASLISGISAEQATLLFRAGADVLTGGNHTLRNRSAYTAMEDTEAWLRPLNFGAEAPGHGSAIVQAEGYRVLVLNAMGTVHMEPTLDSPYGWIDRTLAREEGRYDLAVLDLHAEATGEKLALAYAYDGRITAVFGTHTHVPTADVQVLPKGTGYVTDLGMTGPKRSVLGIRPELSIAKFRGDLTSRYQWAEGETKMEAVVFTIDAATGSCLRAERVDLND